MKLSDTKMPPSLSGKMSLVLPFALPLAMLLIAATYKDFQEGFAILTVGMLFTVPSCCAIAFCRSDKSAVLVFSVAVISLLLLNYLVSVYGLPVSSD